MTGSANGTSRSDGEKEVFFTRKKVKEIFILEKYINMTRVLIFINRSAGIGLQKKRTTFRAWVKSFERFHWNIVVLSVRRFQI